MEAIASGTAIEKIFVVYGLDDADVHRMRVAAQRAGVPLATMDKRKFADLERELELDKNAAQGVIALRPPKPPISLAQLTQEALASSEHPLLVVLDGITDPHNLGAIARSAEGAGAYGLIMPEHYSAPITPVAVKASAGALEHLPVAKIKRVSNTLNELREQGWNVVGTAAPAPSRYDQVEYGGPLAVVIGSEGEGLHPRVIEACTTVVEIPMHGKVASLNASVAAGIILFEIARHRLK